MTKAIIRTVALAIVGNMLLGSMAFLFALVVGLAVANPCCFPSSTTEAIQFAIGMGLSFSVLYDLIVVVGLFLTRKEIGPHD